MFDFSIFWLQLKKHLFIFYYFCLPLIVHKNIDRKIFVFDWRHEWSCREIFPLVWRTVRRNIWQIRKCLNIFYRGSFLDRHQFIPDPYYVSFCKGSESKINILIKRLPTSLSLDYSIHSYFFHDIWICFSDFFFLHFESGWQKTFFLCQHRYRSLIFVSLR